MATKKKAKKAPAKRVARKVPKEPARKQEPAKAEIVVRVEQTAAIPTASELAEPMRDGKKITLTKTWVGESQLLRILEKTPRQYVYQKPGKGGGKFDYVSVSYITKALNYIFGWNWDFEVLEHGVEGGQVWVKGKLTVHGMKPGETIVKTQFGRADIKFKKNSKDMLDFGNDLKGATSDALKKCASMLGIASDIYGKSEYKEESGVDPLPSRPAPAAPRVYEEPEVQMGEEIVPKKCMQDMGGGKLHGIRISDQEAEFSLRMFGVELCRDHQNGRKG